MTTFNAARKTASTNAAEMAGSLEDITQSGPPTSLPSHAVAEATQLLAKMVAAPDAELLVNAVIKNDKVEKEIARRAPIAKRDITDVNDLKAMSSDQLTELFAGGRSPDPSRFDGEMRGVALAAPHHDTSSFGRFINWVMAKEPWAGKNALTEPGEAMSEGTGKNRIFGGLLCPFEWNIVDSKFSSINDDGSKVIRLDYATPKSLLNKITGCSAVHDEMREVGAPGSGVYLGLAGLAYDGPISSRIFNALLWLAGREERVTKGGEPVPVVYFALQGKPR